MQLFLDAVDRVGWGCRDGRGTSGGRLGCVPQAEMRVPRQPHFLGGRGAWEAKPAGALIL